MRFQVARIGFAVAAGLFVLSFIMVAGQPAVAQDKPAPKYVGAVTCAKICHKSAKQGKQLSIWQGTKHASAFATLASEKGKG